MWYVTNKLSRKFLHENSDEALAVCIPFIVQFLQGDQKCEMDMSNINFTSAAKGRSHWLMCAKIILG